MVIPTTDSTSSCPGTSCHHWRQRRERRDHPSDLSNSFLNKRSLSDSPSSVSTTDTPGDATVDARLFALADRLMRRYYPRRFV
jgi:hypothetical protein